MAQRGSAIAGGVSVLVVTAAVTFLFFGQPGARLTHYLAGAVVAGLLLLGAWLLARFVRTHGDEIGEARFDTRNKDGGDG